MKTPQTDEWLTRFSGEHLFHELKMFWWLNENIKLQKDEYMKDALVELFVLHLRNLIDFFYPRQNAQDSDVIASDFIDIASGWASPSSITDSLKAARRRADKELSHLTADRKDEGDPTKPWEVGALFTEIKGLAKTFAAKASPKKLDCKVRELIDAPSNKVIHVLGAYAHSSNITLDRTNYDSFSTGTWKKGQ